MGAVGLPVYNYYCCYYYVRLMQFVKIFDNARGTCENVAHKKNLYENL